MTTYEGIDGSLTVRGDTLVIEFKKRLTKFKGGSTFTVPLDRITHVEYMPATFLLRERIHIRAAELAQNADAMRDQGFLHLGSKRAGESFATMLQQLCTMQVAPASTVSASLNGYKIRDGYLHKVGSTKRWPLDGASASITMGRERKTVTAGRVVALGLLSLAAKKDRTNLYININTPAGPVTIEAPATQERAAHTFVAAINQN